MLCNLTAAIIFAGSSLSGTNHLGNQLPNQMLNSSCSDRSENLQHNYSSASSSSSTLAALDHSSRSRRNPSQRIESADFAKAEAAAEPAPDIQQPNAASDHRLSRVALLLPLQEKNLQAAAQAIYAGVLNAFTQDREGMELRLIETSEDPQQIVEAYNQAQKNADIVIGPLTRASVKEVIAHGVIRRPTIALALPEGAVGETALPAQMLAIGLSLEEEARQVARWAHDATTLSNQSAFVLATPTTWQRRAQKAFSAEWTRLQGKPVSIEIPASSGSSFSEGVQQLQELVESEKPALVFAALDAQQTLEVYTALGHLTRIYGTSQANPANLKNGATESKTTTLELKNAAQSKSSEEGIWFVDMPWQLQPDHAAVMTYQQQRLNLSESIPGSLANADLERLYALGIDAYRIAQQLALSGHAETRFEIDGVTGKLLIDFAQAADGKTDAAASFSRVEEPAIYRAHKVSPLYESP